MRLVLALAIRGLRRTKSGSKRLQILAHKPKATDLEYLQELVIAGKLKPVIDQELSLTEVPKALDKIGSGDVRGKLIIRPEK